MSGYSVNLYDYTPPIREDGLPWTKAQINYSPDGVQAYTVLTTIDFLSLDADPKFPTTRSFTVSAPTATGFLLVIFLDAGSNQAPTQPVQYPAPTGVGAASPTLLSARYAVRHRLRDGMPWMDANPMPFNMVRLESLSDQIDVVPTPTQTVFQCRFADVPTQRYMNAQVIPGTLVAYLDGAWTPTLPVKDVDQNGNFTLPAVPVNQLLITYGWQYLSDGEVDLFVDEGRQWLREFRSVDQIPDGLVPALIEKASAAALYALARSAILAPVRAGDSDVDWSALAKAYQTQAAQSHAMAEEHRKLYYTQGPEALDPTAADISSIRISPYTPQR